MRDDRETAQWYSVLQEAERRALVNGIQGAVCYGLAISYNLLPDAAKEAVEAHRLKHQSLWRFAITHVDEHGQRTLTFANQGRNHYETREAAEKAMREFEPDLRAKVLGDRADSLEVRDVECWPSGDAKGIYFN